MLRLLQLTDTHLMADPAARLRGVATQPSLAACLARARRLHLPVDAIVVTGDLVQDDPAAYGALELTLDRLDAPILLVPGNHDAPDELRRQLAHEPFQVGGTRDLGNWTIVLLETWFDGSMDGEGQLGDAQLEKLDATLAGQEDRHVLIAMHHPPIAMEASGLDALGLLDAPAFLATIDRHPQVRGIAWGHAHQALDVYRGERRLMCTPSTCMQFKPRVAGFVTDERPPGYRIIELHDDGGLASEVVWLEGYRE
jgi:Icc protein